MNDLLKSPLFWTAVSILGSYLFGETADTIKAFLARRRELAIKKRAEELKNAAGIIADECVIAAEMLHYNAGRYYTCRIIDLLNYNYYRTGALLWVIGYIGLMELARSVFQVSIGFPYAVFFGYMTLRCMKRANRIRLTITFLPKVIDIVDEIYAKRGKDESNGVEQKSTTNPNE